MDEWIAPPELEIGWANQTVLHPLGLAAVLVLGVLLMVLPRRTAVLPLIIMASFVASAQRLTILGVDMDLLRIMVLFGWGRLAIRNEFRGFRWKTIDKVLIVWLAAGTVVYSLQYGTAAALLNRLGHAYDAVGMYFLFRCLLQNWEDVRRCVLGIAVVSLPVALVFLTENRTGHNLFAMFGGVPETTMVREGRMRCQGAFSHPILAGCFWASLMPLMAALWWSEPRWRTWVVIGLASAAVIVLCCASSTPVVSILAGLAAAALFPWRHQLRRLRWLALLGLVALHFSMNAPVWHLLSRFSAVGGSTGWHRFYLLDQAIRRTGEWWLLGTRSTAHWGLGLGDVTNQYVLEGVRGGLVTLVLFVVLVALAFGGIGRRLARVEYAPAAQALVWALGVTLFMHTLNFIAVSYFGQIIMIWYLVLAMAGSLTPPRWEPAPALQPGHAPSLTAAPVGGHLTC